MFSPDSQREYKLLDKPLEAANRSTELYPTSILISRTDVSKDKMIEIITYNADSSEGLQFLIKARATGTYLLNTPTTTYGSQVFNYFNPSQIYESIAGTVTITKYDLANKKISGTFEIKLGRSSKSTIVEKENTKGEFNDVKFTK